jgi:serine/threonine-protein kinase
MTAIPERLTIALADRYRIERELGQGGMATVYLAQDLKHDRKVAIKVLRPELAAVIGAERFLREIKTIANLQHPHILGLIDSGEVNGTAYYVMPFVEGESLRDRLSRDKQLPINLAVRIATEVASALDYAHRHGVIHRDIKPENILLHDGSALVADFGIALAVSSAGGSRMTETGMSLGTPHYMSPEQAMGEREITARSDVYALGCVTYEMLVGDPPFTGSTAQAIVAKVMTEKPVPPSRMRDTVAPHVEDAVLTALSKLPADRQSSAAEFGAELEGRSAAQEVRRTTASRGAASASRPSVRLSLSYGIILLSCIALAIWGWLRPAPDAPTSRQRVTLWRHSLGSMLSPGVSRIGTQAAIAPDGSSIVFADPINDSSPLRLKLRNEVDSRPMAGTEGGLSPSYSRDGRWIAFVIPGGKLRKVPVEGGAPITLSTDGNAIYASAAWMDDGSIVYVGANAELRRVSSDGGPSRALGHIAERSASNAGLLSPLPGEHGVLFTYCPGNCAVGSSIYVFDIPADSSRLLIPDAIEAWYSPTGHLIYADRAGALFAATFDLKRLSLTSSAVPVLANVLPGSFAMSPSGSVLYGMASGGSAPAELVWVSRQGHLEPVDTTWRADFQYPALSPDGKMLAVSVTEGSTQIWIRRPDGTRQRLTDSGSVNWRPSWSADGRSIAFLSNRAGPAQENYDAYQVAVDGSAPARLLMDYPAFGLWEAEVSADGQWLVIRADEEGNLGRIRARRLTGDTTLIPLVVGQFLANNVSLSPDGHWLAYVADRSGRKEVYVAPFPAGTPSHVVSRNGGTEIRWAHSGRELFFKGDGEHQLMAVPILPGPGFVAGTPVPLFDLANYREARNRQQYDVSPDGQRFLMIRKLTGDEAASVVLAEHWFAELDSKVRAKR